MHGLAILSFFKKTKIWNCPYLPKVGAFAHSFKAPWWDDWGFCTLLCSSLILLNPFQTNFPVYHKTLCRQTKNLLQRSFVIGTKYLKILHGTVVNSVQDRLSLFITLPTINL